MIPAPVGYQCPECVHAAAPAARSARPRTLAGGTVASDPRLLTLVILGLNVVMFLAVQGVGDRLVIDLGMLGYARDDRFPFPWIGVADGEWYRLLTAAFLHQQLWHVFANMLALYFLGPPLEAALGRARFAALYLISALAGSTLSYVLAPQNELSLGASGAIFGLFGATAVLARRLRYDLRPIAGLLAVNLAITFVVPDIAWQAHIGGLVAGAAVAAGMVYAPRARRTAVQAGACAVVLLVIAAACVARTSALL
jgi:membrane associated rhomboid family serine protease